MPAKEKRHLPAFQLHLNLWSGSGGLKKQKKNIMVQTLQDAVQEDDEPPAKTSWCPAG